ncbi:MAG TPA: hypothetical protein VFG37_02610 [Planctomycetota bacterium]|nr:hypothetical protein [Planctomycetota bacterium]
MQRRPVVYALFALAALGANAASRAATQESRDPANAASQESGEDPTDAISGTLADRDAERFTRRGVVLDEHFREIACESKDPPEPPTDAAADAAHRPADPVAAASSDASEWIAVGAISLLGAVLVLLFTRRTRRRV